MRRAVLFTMTAIVGCTDISHRPPPGPTPFPEPWRPDAVLRARVPRGNGGAIVLDDRDGLSPDEAALLAVDQNPRLRAARAERGIGQAEIVAAGILPNPRLDAEIDVPIGGKDATVLGYGAGLSWNVTPLLSRGARVSAAEENRTAIDLDIAWQEWQVAQSARLHAVRAIYLERRVAVTREQEATCRRRLEAVRQARAGGAVIELEVTNAERSYAQARVSRLELEQRTVAERAELNRAIGIDPAKDLAIDLSFAPPTTEPSGPELLDELPRRRLDLIALQHACRSHDEGLRAAAIAQFPPIEIGFRARREIDKNVSAGASLTFELPFFDRNQGPIARERALRTQVEAEYDARLLEARADVVRAVRELGLVREQLAASHEASEAAGRLAEQARAAAVGGALSPLIAADTFERFYGSRLRVLEVEQTLVELDIALAVASGAELR